MQMKNSKNVLKYLIGKGSINNLSELLSSHKQNTHIYLVDIFFKDNGTLTNSLPIRSNDLLFFVDSTDEPSTNYINNLLENIQNQYTTFPSAIIGIGGGTTLDTAKAISNLLTNEGKAEDYQGWDLVKKAGVYKIGIPTISGTGAEASRTCVMTNYKTGLKLGMNSDHTIYDQLILDPNLTKTVPRNQYFYTGMDTYIHCLESLNGSHRHALSDAFSHQAIQLCREVFLSEDMMSDENREKLMVASYLGGCAIANSFVGVVHPFSAGLSVALGTHHCIGNCITMTAMEAFYPKEIEEFWKMADKQGVDIPRGIAKNLPEEKYNTLYNSTVIHEKPLANALGQHFADILTFEKVKETFKLM